MRQLLIPAGGTVRFAVFNLHDAKPLLEIDGPTDWARPVVGLVFGSWWGGSPHPLKPTDSGPFKWLDATPLVVDETGQVFGVHDYLESVVGEDHWDHTAHIYTPHIAGPVTEAPRVRRLAGAAS